MSISRYGTSVNNPDAPRFYVHPAAEYGVYTVVEHTVEAGRDTLIAYTVRYSGMYYCDCPARYRLASKCAHILQVVAHRRDAPPEAEWPAPKPPAPNGGKRVKLVQKGRAPLPPVHRVAEHHAQLGRELREFERWQAKLRAELKAREERKVWDALYGEDDPRLKQAAE
jgi:hypothetical protein